MYSRTKAGIERREKVLGEDEALGLFRQAVKSADLGLAPAQVPSLFHEVSLLKQTLVELLGHRWRDHGWTSLRCVRKAFEKHWGL